jgi:integrase
MNTENIRKAADDAANTRKRVEAADDDCKGLALGSSPHGVQTWSLRVRDSFGRLRRFPLGHFPDIGVSAARRAARTTRAAVEAGGDPIADRRAKRDAGAALRAGVGTFRSVIDQYEREAKPPKTWFTAAGRRRVERVFSSLYSMPVATMKPSDILRARDGYAGSEGAADNAIRALKPVLSWAAQRDYVPAVLATVKVGSGVAERGRVLDRAELRRVFPLLHADKSHGAAMLFMLLTLARREEVAGARWREIDFEGEAWVIPPERQKDTKARKRKAARDPFVIPLSGQALRLLRRVRPEHPNPDALIFQTERGCPLGNWDRVQKRMFDISGTAGWHRHDLRRTGSTFLGNVGVLPHVISAALNHVVLHSDLQNRYNFARYFSDVKKCLQNLAVEYYAIGGIYREAPDEYGEASVVSVDLYEAGESLAGLPRSVARPALESLIRLPPTGAGALAG